MNAQRTIVYEVSLASCQFATVLSDAMGSFHKPTRW